jgi:hypothetical protein
MAKTATVYGYVGATHWRRIIEYRNSRLTELTGDRESGDTMAKATLEAWLLINGFTHYRFGPQGRKHTL